MLNSGKKIRASHDKKKIFLLSCCPKFFFGTKQKTIPPPLQVKWSVPKRHLLSKFRIFITRTIDFLNLELETLK